MRVAVSHPDDIILGFEELPCLVGFTPVLDKRPGILGPKTGICRAAGSVLYDAELSD
jgi:hypothetical protein